MQFNYKSLIFCSYLNKDVNLWTKLWKSLHGIYCKHLIVLIQFSYIEICLVWSFFERHFWSHYESSNWNLFVTDWTIKANSITVIILKSLNIKQFLKTCKTYTFSAEKHHNAAQRKDKTWKPFFSSNREKWRGMGK